MMKPAKDSLDIGVIVSDIKASLNFYQNILGLEFVGSVPLWFGTMHRLRFGASDFKLIEFTLPETEIRPGVRIAMVKDPDGNIVEFVERS
jgi:catechol 2,3-dioxygenase-like lactoylglutathione lyase family enzyme